MKQLDLLSPQSPAQLADILRQAAQQYREDASGLQAAWQDDSAGSIWITAAAGFERLADKIQREWERL